MWNETKISGGPDVWKFSQAACMCYGLYSYFPLDDFLCFLQLECKLHWVQVVVLVSDTAKSPEQYLIQSIQLDISLTPWWTNQLTTSEIKVIVFS